MFLVLLLLSLLFQLHPRVVVCTYDEVADGKEDRPTLWDDELLCENHEDWAGYDRGGGHLDEARFQGGENDRGNESQ